MAVFYGSEDNDALFATSSDDAAYGFGGDDVLIGYAGSDFLQGGVGADWLDGGDGIDTADYNGNAGVTVDLGSGRGYGGEAEGDSLLNIENVLGTTGYGDTLIGNGAANGLSGYGGNDSLRGQDGDDSLSGMDGDDFLLGGSGADTLNGGAGIDTADYNGTGGVYIDLSTGLGYWGEAEGDILSGIENVWGTAGYHDKLIGSEVDNVLSGFGGSDDLWGLGGNDTLVGGGDGDTMVGGAGNDVLQGDGGDDFLAGASGADSFRYLATSDSQGDLIDYIADFSHAEGDRIDLSAIDADIRTAGDQAFSFIWSAAFTGSSGQLRAEVSGSDTIVSADVDGDAVADLTIICQNTAGLVAPDFVL